MKTHVTVPKATSPFCGDPRADVSMILDDPRGMLDLLVDPKYGICGRCITAIAGHEGEYQSKIRKELEANGVSL